jgi:hypothetical protein
MPSIGCDGVKSQVRRLLLGETDPAARAQFTGKYAYRGLIQMDKAVGLLGDELVRNSQMYSALQNIPCHPMPTDAETGDDESGGGRKV